MYVCTFYACMYVCIRVCVYVWIVITILVDQECVCCLMTCQLIEVHEPKLPGSILTGRVNVRYIHVAYTCGR